MKSDQMGILQSRLTASTLHDVRSGVGAINGIGDELKRLIKVQSGILGALTQATDPFILLTLQKKLQENLNQVNELMSVFDQSRQSITNLTTDYLDAKKLESGKWGLNPEKFLVVALVKSVIASFDQEAKKNDITLGYHGLQEDIQIIGDSNLLYRVLLNLISNALKYTPKKGVIQITLQASLGGEDQVNVICSVQDSGRGMNEEQMSRLFQDFSQACPEDAKNGTGFGLVNCKEFVEMMGGKIEVASALGKGSRFTFNAICKRVLTEPVSLTPKAKTLPPKSSELKNVRVLIAEDNKINRMILTKLIQAAGGTVVVAGNGQEALDQLTQGEFDIILMDLEMPIMDGLAAARKIRGIEQETNSAQIPIIALSGHTGGGVEQTASEAGMNGYLTKPFDNTVILAAVKQLLKINMEPATESKLSDEKSATQVKATPKEEEKTIQQSPKKRARGGVQRSKSDELSSDSFFRYSDSYAEAKELLFNLQEQLYVTFPPSHNDDDGISRNLRRQYVEVFAEYNRRLRTKEGLSGYDIETLKEKLEYLKKLACAPDSEKAALLSPHQPAGYNPNFKFSSNKRKMESGAGNVTMPKCT